MVLDPLNGADCDTGGGSSAPHPCWCDGTNSRWRSLLALGLTNHEMLTVNSSGDVALPRFLTPPGATAGKAYITVDGDDGGSRDGGIVFQSTVSDLQIRTQNGTGRASICWNTDCDATPVTLTSSEDAFQMLLTTDNPGFTFHTFEGTATSAGASITWLETLRVTDLDVTYKSVSLRNPTAKARCEVTKTAFPAAAMTAVTFTSGCAEDTNTMFSAGTNSRITIKTAGHYLVVAEGKFTALSLPVWGRIRLGGSTVLAYCSGYMVAGSEVDGTSCTITLARTFAVNDYLETVWQQNTSGSTTVNATFRFSATLLQP